MPKPKLILGVTISGSTLLLQGQSKYFSSLGYDVHLFCPKDEKSVNYSENENCTLHHVRIARTLNPIKDVVTLVRLIRLLKSQKPDIINFGTSKMGFLGSIAAWICNVPVRIYTCRGLRYEHEKGLLKKVLMLTEKIASKCTHKTICVGNALRDVAVNDNVFDSKKAVVIAKGASNGVDLNSFDKSMLDETERQNLIREYNLEDKLVLGFVGRIIDRKGINELVHSFQAINKKYPDTRLMLLGRINYEQLRDKSVLDLIENDENIINAGFQEDVPLYMSLFDIYVQPSWWEGFANALIQAASMELPIVTSDGTGCWDAVADDYNAIVVPVNNKVELTKAMERYVQSSQLRFEHGKNSRKWAANFQHEIIWDGLNTLYTSLLRDKKVLRST